MNQITEQESIYILNSLLVGYEFLECIDKIKEFKVYRNGLKQKVNLLVPELEKFTDQIGVLFGIDDAAMFDILEKKKELMKKLATLRPENKSGLNEIIDIYLNEPELTLYRLGVAVKKS